MATRQEQKPFSVAINKFRTWNTQDSPVSAPETDLPLLLNFMPIGTSLYTFKGASEAINSVTAGLNIVRMFRGIAGGTTYQFVFCDDGSLFRFDNGFTGTPTIIAVAGTLNNPQFAQWKSERILIIDSTGYYTYDGTTFTKETAGAPGNAIAVFKGRVFIGFARTIMFSAPDDVSGLPGYNNFDVAYGAGAVPDNYPSLGDGIVAFASTQEYLYVFGDAGTHVIYGLQILSDSTTTFTLGNQFPNIGTINPDSVITVADTVFFMNDRGVFAFAGLSYDTNSDFLNGVLSKINKTFNPVGFYGKIRNNPVVGFLVDILSPIDNVSQRWIIAYSGGRWFPIAVNTGVEGNDLTIGFILQASFNLEDTTYIATGNEIRTLFDGTLPMRRKVRTKSMNFQAPTYDKQALKVGVTIDREDGDIISPTIFIHSAQDGASKTIVFDDILNAVVFVNTIGGVETTVSFVNDNNDPIAWDVAFGESDTFTDIEGQGKRLAIDFEEISSSQYSLNELLIEAQLLKEF